MVTREEYRHLVAKYGEENLYKPIEGFPSARRIEVTNGKKVQKKRVRRTKARRVKGKKVVLQRIRPKVASKDPIRTYFDIGL